jgi:hypothetical protein
MAHQLGEKIKDALGMGRVPEQGYCMRARPPIRRRSTQPISEPVWDRLLMRHWSCDLGIRVPL